MLSAKPEAFQVLAPCIVQVASLHGEQALGPYNLTTGLKQSRGTQSASFVDGLIRRRKLT
jgi:hypothetical protein